MKTPAALIAVAALVALGAAPASASEGSVPVEVAEFVAAPDGLIASLDDYFGVGADGEGYDFDHTTTVGTIDRVWSFTPAWIGGDSTVEAVGLSNEWTVAVSIADEPVGLAIVWINPGSVRPELADFVPDPAVAEAFGDVPDGSYVVHDTAHGAWFVLDPPTLTPVIAGTSSLSGPTSLGVYQRALQEEEPVATYPGPNLGSALSIGIIVAVALIVILVLLVPLAWRRRRERADADA